MLANESQDADVVPSVGRCLMCQATNVPNASRREYYGVSCQRTGRHCILQCWVAVCSLGAVLDAL
eukprot:10676521-Alexandrium_andersonii.AAC.1